MRHALPLLLLATIALAGSASADPMPPGFDGIFQAMRTTVTIPQEWDGIWTATDSIYTCAGVFQSTNVVTDTLCGGKDYSSTQSGSIAFTCTGTATATTIDVTCTGSETIFTDCTANFAITTHGTLSTNTFFVVTVVNVTYSGTGTGCSLLPPTCSQINSHGEWKGPAPTAFCSTAARPATWGRIKTLYR